MTRVALTEEKIVNRLDKLIGTADYLISTRQRTTGIAGSPTVSSQDYQRWRTSSENLITSVCGANSTYLTNFINAAKPSAYAKNVSAGNGVLLAIKDDLVSGYFTSSSSVANFNKSTVSTATVANASVNLQLSSAVYSHIAPYLDKEDYFHAVEEAYKVVREKLREVTGKEKASDIFNANAESNKYHKVIFGKATEVGTPESDFFRGVGYLNLAIQFLRNEKSHTLATTLDKNLAIHYISLASLVYDLISAGGEKK